MSDSPSKQVPPFGLRLPPDLKGRVQEAAEANNRSMNAEIIARLQQSFEAPGFTPAMEERLKVILRKMMDEDKLEGRAGE